MLDLKINHWEFKSKYQLGRKRTLFLRMMTEQQELYQIHLPLFEGPFDLLLFFIERDELDIFNIPISKITKDFLEYVNHLEEINLDIAGEFIVTAATLMRIKSRMLLPVSKSDNAEEEVDPRQELVNKILLFKSFKEIASELGQLEELRMKLHKRGNIDEELKRFQTYTASYSELESANIYKLYTIYKKLLEEKNKPRSGFVHRVANFNYTIQECSFIIVERIKNHSRIGFTSLFDIIENRLHAIIMFLSVLELVNQQKVELVNGSEANEFWLTEKASTEEI